MVHPEPLEIEPGLRWYCARTEFKAENLAEHSLRTLGFHVFLPQELRKADRRKLNDYDRIVPLFPRYLFVQFDTGEPGWRHAFAARGVERVMGTAPERPTPVPQLAIDLILEQCAPNGVIYPDEPKEYAAIPRGAEVRILTGPLAGFIGICQMSQRRRVRLLVEMFGRTVKTEIKQNDVQVV